MLPTVTTQTFVHNGFALRLRKEREAEYSTLARKKRGLGLVNRRKPEVTQRTLADLAGVSIATVSRVLNSPAEERHRWAGPSTIEKILTLADEQEYRRNPHAASLRTARSGLIGVLVPRLQDFVMATIYEGMDEVATEHGMTTYVVNTLDRAEHQRARAEAMLDRRVDGLIFCDSRLDTAHPENLDLGGIPFILANRRKGDHIGVTCDDYLGGQLAAEHLLNLDRTDVVVLGGYHYSSTAQDRTRGFLDTYRQAGVEVPEDHVLFPGFDTLSGREGTRELLNRGFRPDAIFAANDFAAIGVLGALQESGYRVPEDVGLVGYNDTPLASSVGVPLSTVRSPMHEIGRRSMHTLLAVMAGRDAESEWLRPTFVSRASTA